MSIINLRHEGCGGFYHGWASQGRYALFRCEKCDLETMALMMDDASEARFEERRERDRREMAERMASTPEPAPPTPIRTATDHEALVLAAYRFWSEEVYAAGFLSPDESHVGEFHAWLSNQLIFDDYEVDMLRLWEVLR